MYYLGIDGGGTRTDYMIINEIGSVLTKFMTTNIDIMQIGIEEFHKTLSSGIETVCNDLNISASDIQYSVLGIPCLGDELIEEIPLINEVVAKILKSNRFRCMNDVEVAWAGSLACQPGIHIAAGTGAIGYGVDYERKTARVGGWSHFCNNEGSAYWLGKQVITIFTREADGREEKSQIYESVINHFQLKSDFEILSVLKNKLKYKRHKIAELAQLLYKVALNGDEKAKRLFKDAATELSLIVLTLKKELNFSSNKMTKVSYSGGMFNAEELILDHLQNLLNTDHMKLIKPALQPVTGAALYAMSKSNTSKQPLTKVVEKLQEQESYYL